jgi:phosphoglycerol transferase MdoB-like AlkP superfamily enzyme
MAYGKGIQSEEVGRVNKTSHHSLRRPALDAVGALRTIALRLLVLLGLYSALRLLFFALHHHSFPNAPLAAFFGGIRFDLCALVWLNAPWLLLFMVHPLPAHRSARVQWWAYMLANGAGLFFACVDLEYYPFTLRRSTADLFNIMVGGRDVLGLTPSFLRDYWYVVLMFLGGIFLIHSTYRRTLPKNSRRDPTQLERITWRVGTFIFLAVAARGGLQYLPIGVLSAANYSSASYFPLALNTPFTMIMSIGKPVLDEVHHMPESEAQRIWPVFHEHRDRSPVGSTLVLGKTNVVVVVLESFSAEYSTHLSGRPGYMPFLDSLMQQSLCYTRAYANGRRSIDGIPAVLAGIPELMDEAFIASPYAQTRFTALGNTLRDVGYHTSFFHGGNNGSMGFDAFARSAGFKRYIGRNQYPHQEDYDGSWGIRDRPFLKFFAEKLSEQPQPFASCVFTLSSHHPYDLLPEDTLRFLPGTLPIHRTLRYTDDALRQFFQVARTQPWFANTLFVITADHTADIERTGQHYTQASDYWVPLLFHMPNALLPEQRDRVVQHIDILPTVLDLLGYSRPYFCFGSSALRNDHPEVAVSYGTGAYLVIDSVGATQYTADEVTLRAKAPGRQGDRARQLAAVAQQFSHYMANRKLALPAR